MEPPSRRRCQHSPNSRGREDLTLHRCQGKFLHSPRRRHDNFQHSQDSTRDEPCQRSAASRPRHFEEGNTDDTPPISHAHEDGITKYVMHANKDIRCAHPVGSVPAHRHG